MSEAAFFNIYADADHDIEDGVVTCQVCNGSGYDPMDGFSECDECDGEGWLW